MKKFIFMALFISLITGCKTKVEIEEPTNNIIQEESVIETIESVIEQDYKLEDTTCNIEVEANMTKAEFVDLLKSIKANDYIKYVTTNHILTTGVFPENYITKTVNFVKYLDDGKITVEIKKLYNNEAIETRLGFYDLCRQRNGDTIGSEAIEVISDIRNAVGFKYDETSVFMAIIGNLELTINTPTEYFDEVVNKFYTKVFEGTSYIVDLEGLHTVDLYFDTVNSDSYELIELINEDFTNMTPEMQSVMTQELNRLQNSINTMENQIVYRFDTSAEELYRIIEGLVPVDADISIHSPMSNYTDMRAYFHFSVDYPSVNYGSNHLNIYPVTESDFRDLYNYYHSENEDFSVDEPGIVYDRTGNTYYIFSGNIIYEFIIHTGVPIEDYIPTIYFIREIDKTVDTLSMMELYNK